MRKLLTILLSALAVSGMAQTAGTTITVPTNASGSTEPAYLYKPDNYATATSTFYPIIIFLHGAGESCPPLSNIYNNSSSGGPLYFIEHGQWPSSFVNPADGLSYKFLVAGPQSNCNSWSTDGNQLDFIIRNLVATYRVDVNRIYITGLSAGGDGIYRYMGHIANDAGVIPVPMYPAAAAVPMSEAGGFPAQSAMNQMNSDKVFEWGFGDPNNDTHGYNTQQLIAGLNLLTPGRGRFTSYGSGHCCWGTFYNPNYRETVNGKSMNIYEWMLQYTRAAALPIPIVNAGSNQVITLPANSIQLSGSATPAPSKTIASYAWTQLSGPNTATMSAPTVQINTVSNLIQGVYTFQLTATQSDAQTGSGTVQITVNPASPPTVVAGLNQTIQLPTASVILNGIVTAASGQTITSQLWTQTSGPNTPTIVAPGSVNTAVNGLVQGVYVFKLTANQSNGQSANASTTVTVNPANASGGCTGARYYMAPQYQNGLYITTPGSPKGQGIDPSQFHGGDTLVLQANIVWGDIVIDGLHGTSDACPIVIINEGGITQYRTEHLYNSTFVHFTGTGVAGQLGEFYGFIAQVGDSCTNLGGVGISFEERSKNVHYDHIWIRNVNQGVFAHTEGSCTDSISYVGGWVMDNFEVDHCKIENTAHEGMYIGSTSPDNAKNSYDPHPFFCDSAGGQATIPTYSRPMRIGNVHIHDCIVTNTGRGGIQVASATLSSMQEIDHNFVTHSGMSGVDNQGTGISIGSYCHAYIHDNTVDTTLSFGIASLGGSGTGVPVRIENNNIDHSGIGKTYNNIDDEQIVCPSSPMYDPGTIPGNTFPITYIASIFLKTAPTEDTDSTTFWIKNNILGASAGGVNKIKIQNGYATITQTGNIICNNLNHDSTVAGIDADLGTFATYTTVCSGVIPPPPPSLNIQRVRISLRRRIFPK